MPSEMAALEGWRFLGRLSCACTGAAVAMSRTAEPARDDVDGEEDRPDAEETADSASRSTSRSNASEGTPGLDFMLVARAFVGVITGHTTFSIVSRRETGQA